MSSYETALAADPEVADLIGQELNRQQTTLQLIASENFTSPAVLAASGSVLTNKYSRGLPGPALLRRQPDHRRGRGPGPRPGQGALRGRARQRAAPRRGQRQPGRLPGAARAGRHHPGHAARPRRPPHARLAGLHRLEVLALRLLRRDARVAATRPNSGRGHRLRPGGPPGQDGEAGPDRRRLDRLRPRHRPAALPGDRRLGRGAASCSTPPTRPGSSPAARTRARSAWPTWSPSPPTRRCAARGVAPSCAARTWPRRSTAPCSRASRAVRSSTSSRPRRWPSPRRPSPSSAATRPQVVANAAALADGPGRRTASGWSRVGTDNHMLLVDLRPFDAELTGKEAQEVLDRAGITLQPQHHPRRPALALPHLGPAPGHGGRDDGGHGRRPRCRSSPT